MKYTFKVLLIILIILGCNNEPKQPEIEVGDSSSLSKKIAPPLGTQNAQTDEGLVLGKPMARALAMAIATTPDSMKILSNGDTVLYFSETKTQTGTTSYTFSYKVPRLEIRTKGTTPTPVPDPPVIGVKYLTLPISGPLDLSGKSNQIVENKRFVNTPGVSIKLYSGANNIIIRNCFFNGAAGEIVELENASNITIENCVFAKGLAGVYAVGSRNIKIINCQFVNMRIRRTSTGGFAGRGVFAQFNSCSDIEMSGCKGENFAGESDAEDMVSFFKSSNGIVRNNIFRGCGTSTTSTSGGGIIAGDNGGDNVLLESNTLMTPGNYGMAIAGGTNMKILNNKIYSERNPVSNNPLYVWSQAGATCANITVKGNRVYWIDKNGARNNGWDAKNCSNTIFETPTNITLSEMNVPSHLITFVTEAELLTIRK
jgi:parallel beta-helix repeat protein